MQTPHTRETGPMLLHLWVGVYTSHAVAVKTAISSPLLTVAAQLLTPTPVCPQYVRHVAVVGEP